MLHSCHFYIYRVNVLTQTKLFAKVAPRQRFSNLIVQQLKILDMNILDILILTVSFEVHLSPLNLINIFILFSDCQYFYICIAGQARRNGCQVGLVFNKDTLACDSQSNLKNDRVCSQWYNDTYLEGIQAPPSRPGGIPIDTEQRQRVVVRRKKPVPIQQQVLYWWINQIRIQGVKRSWRTLTLMSCWEKVCVCIFGTHSILFGHSFWSVWMNDFWKVSCT